MKKVFEQFDNIQFDHLRWMNELLFSAKEIKLYQSRLLELMKASDEKEKVEALKEMFKEFDKQKQLAISIQSEIKKHVIDIKQLSHSNGELKAMVNHNHGKTRQGIETFRQQYTNIKETFHRFSALQD